MGLPPPYWAFAWAGGQALARYRARQSARWSRASACSISRPARGSSAIAAAKAGAAPVLAADIDAFTEAAIALNAEANDVYVEYRRRICSIFRRRPRRATTSSWSATCSMSATPAARALAFVDRHAATGARVLIGDPGRTYLPKERLTRLAEYSVPVTRELEDMEIKQTAVWELVP